MNDEVLTIEHLEAVKDLWFGLHPTFDIELFKANNPFFSLDFLLTPTTITTTHSNKNNKQR